MKKALSAPNGLQNIMIFPHISLRNGKKIWLNETPGEMNLDCVGKKYFQTCLIYGNISENKFESERKLPHYAGNSNHKFNS